MSNLIPEKNLCAGGNDGGFSLFSLPFTLDPLPYFQGKPSCAGGAQLSMKIGVLSGGDA